VNGTRRSIAALVAGLAAAVWVPFYWWTSGGGFDGWTLAFAIWQVIPFGLLLLLHGRGGFSNIGTLLTAVAVAGFIVVGYVEILRSDSSTAALGLLYLPIYSVVVVVIAAVVDLIARTVVKRLARPPGKPIPR
jgi:hypothetical protein